ncbi:hypothetical protein HZH68_004701 [Vespula germanica]|uniref:Uncharacterized protein n=1 Tax=Vespula germanica TaxID=30212 RepID=A0A834KPL7_VESGE|nr:hypothetical protein HZH68_004701 [Vespula germanica]
MADMSKRCPPCRNFLGHPVSREDDSANTVLRVERGTGRLAISSGEATETGEGRGQEDLSSRANPEYPNSGIESGPSVFPFSCIFRKGVRPRRKRVSFKSNEDSTAVPISWTVR